MISAQNRLRQLNGSSRPAEILGSRPGDPLRLHWSRLSNQPLSAVVLAVWVVFVLLISLSQPVAAQVGRETVPRIEDAELIFDQALQAFQQEDYGMAYRRFRLVYTSYPLNQKTTAALLMAGKALYRDDAYNEAIEVFSELTRLYPTSSYIDEALHVQELARRRIALAAHEERIMELGVILPLTGDPSLTQALFNGIRIAVEEYNVTHGSGSPVRIIFRDSRSSASGARQAIEALSQEGVEIVVGPLYSDEARAAAAAAEAAEVVLVAPLATDESVSEGRDFVFQANPTIIMRGRQMARFAFQKLGLRNFGLVAEIQDRDSERMAEGFQDEAMLLGAEVHFLKLLPGARGWYSLPEELDPELLGRVEALYLPISGSNSLSQIRAALTGLGEIAANVRVLGNKNWHDVNVKSLASQFMTTYTNDFFVREDTPQVEQFLARYRELTGREPSGEERRLAFTGYDVAHYLVTQLGMNSDQPVQEVLRQAPLYNGLGMRINFNNSNVNEALFFFRYRAGQMELLL